MRTCFTARTDITMIATMPSAAPTAMPAMTGAVSPSLSEFESWPGSDVEPDDGGCAGADGGCAGADGGGDGDNNASGGVGGNRGCATQLVTNISRTVCESADVARHVRPITSSVESPKSITQYRDGAVWRPEGEESRAAASI